MPGSLNETYDPAIQSAVKQYWIDFPDWRFLKAQLIQESQLNPLARSSAGAEGIAQFMGPTWVDITRQLKWSGVSANQAGPAITAAAFYMAKLRGQWQRGRVIGERHKLAEASYNAGLGSILTAQRLCQNAILWETVVLCLPDVTGTANARQTADYIMRIARWRKLLED